MKDRTRIELEALITEREGMVAENQQRAHCDQSMAYGAEYFDDLASRIRLLAEKDPNNGWAYGTPTERGWYVTPHKTPDPPEVARYWDGADWRDAARGGAIWLPRERWFRPCSPRPPEEYPANAP